MKHFAFLVLLATLPAHSAQFANLQPGSGYIVWVNGATTSTQADMNGILDVNLPSGHHHIALEVLEASQTPIETETTSPTPTEINIPTPTETPTPSATATNKGREVIVGSFDETNKKNKFEVLSEDGHSLSGSIEVLSGVQTEGMIKTADLNGDSVLEVIAAGYSEEKGVVLEYWSGKGELVRSIEALPSEFNQENYLLTGAEDGLQGGAAIVVGRAPNGSYHMVSVDFQGKSKGTTEVLAPGYRQIEDLTALQSGSEGSREVAILARNDNNSVELNVVRDSALSTSVVLFGNGYTGSPCVFGLDINGDGIQEVGSVSRNSLSDSFRLLVVSAAGQVLLKKNLFPGKFESEATFSAADIDGDGRDEIIAVGRMIGTGSNVIQVLDDDGTQLLARSVLDPSFNSAKSSVLADVNGDGQMEFIVAGKDSVSGVAAYQVLGSNGSLIGGGTIFETPANPILASSDLDEDGQADLLILGEFENGEYGLELRKGSGGQVQFSTTLPSVPSFLNAGDLM